MTGLPHPPVIGLDELLQRQDKVRAAAKLLRLDAVVVIGRSFYERPGDLAYLTGHFPPFPTAVFDSVAHGLGHGICLLPSNGNPVLFVDHASFWHDLVAVDDVRPGPSPFVSLVDELTTHFPQGGAIAIAPPELLPWPVAESIRASCSNLGLVDGRDLLADLRRVKSPAEVQLLRQAADVAGVGLRAAVDAIGPDVTERSISAAGTEAALRAGADFVRYFRVHSGPFSSWGSRWPQATSRPILVGELVAMDIIGAVGGYQFDVNRTAACGRLDPDRLRLCEAVYDATQRCVDAAQAGVTVAALVAIAGDSFAANGFGRHFSGSVGHAIGLETVELPYLRRGVDASLAPGDVVCIEPGLFIAGLGGCGIEQIVVVQEQGPPELLTHFPARLW